MAGAADAAEQVRLQLRADGRSDWVLLCVTDGEARLLGTLSAAARPVLPDTTVLGGRGAA